MLRKLTGVLLMFLVYLSGSYLEASAEGTSTEINLENLKLYGLKPGDEFMIDGYMIKQFTNEEAAKLIAENNGESEKVVLERLNKRASQTSNNLSFGQCAVGTTGFMRYLDVNSEYKPKMWIFTELCQNSQGQFVIKSIVDFTLDRSSNGMVKAFGGSITAQALNGGKTLYYRAEGSWYNNASTTIGFTTGLNTDFATIGFNVSSTSSYYGYIFQTDNIVLFK